MLSLRKFLIESWARTGAIAKPADEHPGKSVERPFEQIGDGEYALPSPSTERARLHGWLSGTPLLLLLALETCGREIRGGGASRRRQSRGADFGSTVWPISDLRLLPQHWQSSQICGQSRKILQLIAVALSTDTRRTIGLN